MTSIFVGSRPLHALTTPGFEPRMLPPAPTGTAAVRKHVRNIVHRSGAAAKDGNLSPRHLAIPVRPMRRIPESRVLDLRK